MVKAIFTGRNEVLSKVIFSQASVILFTGWVSGLVPGGVSNFLGVSNFFGGSPNFRGVSKVLGGLQIYGGFLNFLGEGLHWNTVNVQPVCILLECILVTVCKQSCGKVIFSQACVKNSVYRGRGVSACGMFPG